MGLNYWTVHDGNHSVVERPEDFHDFDQVADTQPVPGEHCYGAELDGRRIGEHCWMVAELDGRKVLAKWMPHIEQTTVSGNVLPGLNLANANHDQYMLSTVQVADYAHHQLVRVDPTLSAAVLYVGQDFAGPAQLHVDGSRSLVTSTTSGGYTAIKRIQPQPAAQETRSQSVANVLRFPVSADETEAAPQPAAQETRSQSVANVLRFH